MNTGRRSLVFATSSWLALAACSTDSKVGFDPSQSVEAWNKFLSYRGSATKTLNPYELVLASLDFFATIEANGLATAPGADMLLYQWGVFDFGKGEYFEFDITRQFIAKGQAGNEAISQFRCTAYFEPDAELQSIPKGNLWCGSKADLSTFKKYILGSKAFSAVENRLASRVTAEWSKA
ncbi:hypothetical protein LNV09_24480 [Paucibacter sp. B2R-40]|uniref:hypothetical protein n=1 Tax=Paucibacter sp. B2R-40 TaxID=2893554 RepID=UPI0021E3CBC0|nr:hypothetical protein [Paucibacter sp. B2R-40]MCV2357314.1 hypothetical protein [Paucibacter sp. B2R-40]